MRLGPWLAEQFQSVHQSLHHINERLDLIMSDQSHLDADVAELSTALTNIQAEIAALKTANPSVDFTALDAVVGQLEAVAPAPPAPPADTTPPVAS